jgi:hypothetical protein
VGKVYGHAAHAGPWRLGHNNRFGFRYPLLGAPGDDDSHAFGRQALRDGQANASRRAGDEGSFARDLEVHEEILEKNFISKPPSQPF